jgi:3-dehydroquinate synthase
LHKIIAMITFLDQDFSQLNAYINQLQPSKIVFLVDENTHDCCLAQVLPNLEINIPFETIEIESGEINKNIETATQLWEIFSEFGLDRKALLINLGGGVITDMGGFVASTYKRGFKFINLPTTLLAMVDASIGGKTGIDHDFLKNIIGTFAHPEQILVFPGFLQTLDPREVRSGFAEMIKHGLIADAQLWRDLVSLPELSVEHLAPYIEHSMAIKQNVVAQDFKEEHLRKTLNFGHTIGHAYESLFIKHEQTIPHGEAIAVGMICEAHLSYQLGLMTEAELTEISQGISKIYPQQNIAQFNMADVMALMLNDKKNQNAQINFSLLKGIGECLWDQKVSEAAIVKAVGYYNALV